MTPILQDWSSIRRGRWDTDTHGGTTCEDTGKGHGKNHPHRRLGLGLPASTLSEIKVCRSQRPSVVLVTTAPGSCWGGGQRTGGPLIQAAAAWTGVRGLRLVRAVAACGCYVCGLRTLCVRQLSQSKGRVSPVRGSTRRLVGGSQHPLWSCPSPGEVFAGRQQCHS